MKLLFLSFYYQPDLSAGSFRSTALIEELKKHPNIDITIITTLPNRYASYNEEATQFDSKANVTVHRIALPAHKSGMVDQAKAFRHFYRGAMAITKHENYDAVYGTSSRLFTAFLTARIAKRKAIPYYLDIRDIFVDTLDDLISPKIMVLARPVLNQIEQYTFQGAETINLVSEGFRNYFEARAQGMRLKYFTNGIDEEFVSSAQNNLNDHEIANRIPSEPEITTILYAGNIGEGQGLHNIIPNLAANLGPSYHIKIIGDGGRKALLEEKCREILNVSLHPPVKREQLIQEYRAADILFLHLNDCQAFEKVLPSKIFEYAAMGKPILAGVAGYAADFLSTEVPNAAVFYPIKTKDALEKLNSLKLRQTDRTSFIQMYNRRSISSKLAKDVVNQLRL